MPTYPTVIPEGNVGELLRGLLANLGISPVPSMGKGELLTLLANAGSGLSQLGGTEFGPANCLAQTFPRNQINSNTIAAPATGVLQMQAVYLMQGMVVSNISFVTGTTAGATLTHQWAGLYDSSRNLLAISADGTSTALGASTAFTYAIANTAAGAATSFTCTYTGLYYIGIVVTNSATQPTFTGLAATAAIAAAIPPILGGTSTGSLTTPSTFPTQAGTITATVNTLYMYLT